MARHRLKAQGTPKYKDLTAIRSAQMAVAYLRQRDMQRDTGGGAGLASKLLLRLGFSRGAGAVKTDRGRAAARPQT